MLTVDETWRKTHSGACVGIMVQTVGDLAANQTLADEKAVLLRFLQTHITSKEELLGYGPIPQYIQYYRRYRKTYHVLPQMESIIFKGKQIPDCTSLVEAMLLAELKNGLLTAGHDGSVLNWPLVLRVATGEEIYTGISGKEQSAKKGDMLIADGQGIISSILGGPDFRTRITAATRRCVFIVYGVPGISSSTLEKHLEQIRGNVASVFEKAVVEFRHIYTA